jgi:hypothetical protein
VDNDNKELNEYHSAETADDAKTTTGQADSNHEEFDVKDLDMDDMDYGKTLLSELDRIERELKLLD